MRPFRLSRLFRLWLPVLCAIAFLSACSTGRVQSNYATGYRVSSPVQCVPYARKISGIGIYGDAHSWWDRAPPRYARGYTPVPGSVMVFSRTPRMRYGHLGVVKRIINSREIDISHSNWGNDRATRSIIYDFMRVQDISSANNWSLVRLWNPHVNAFGSPYPVQGFIYR